jgi:hypothetical protein
MMDVSKVIMAGDFSLREKDGVFQLCVKSYPLGWLTKQQILDLAQVAQMQVERNARTE